jgi:hypothetical protein
MKPFSTFRVQGHGDPASRAKLVLVPHKRFCVGRNRSVEPAVQLYVLLLRQHWARGGQQTLHPWGVSLLASQGRTLTSCILSAVTPSRPSRRPGGAAAARTAAREPPAGARHSGRGEARSPRDWCHGSPSQPMGSEPSPGRGGRSALSSVTRGAAPLISVWSRARVLLSHPGAVRYRAGARCGAEVGASGREDERLREGLRGHAGSEPMGRPSVRAARTPAAWSSPRSAAHPRSRAAGGRGAGREQEAGSGCGCGTSACQSGRSWPAPGSRPAGAGPQPPHSRSAETLPVRGPTPLRPRGFRGRRTWGRRAQRVPSVPAIGEWGAFCMEHSAGQGDFGPRAGTLIALLRREPSRAAPGAPRQPSPSPRPQPSLPVSASRKEMVVQWRARWVDGARRLAQDWGHEDRTLRVPLQPLLSIRKFERSGTLAPGAPRLLPSPCRPDLAWLCSFSFWINEMGERVTLGWSLRFLRSESLLRDFKCLYGDLVLQVNLEPVSRL